MKMFAAVFVCVILFCGSKSHGQEIVIESEASTWAAARQKCRARGPTCDLSTHRLQPQLAPDVWSTPSPLPNGGSSWIGARVLEQLVWKRGQRPLIEDVGCYQTSEDVKTEMHPLRRYSGPERCLTMCTTNIIAIQDSSCYCLSPDKMAALERRPLASCYRYCSREPYRCGGDDSRISVYKILDRTLYEKRGKANTFFWRRSNNNEQEFLIFTNRPGKQKQQFCASPDGGSYSTTKPKAPCPNGAQPMSFEGVDVGQFVANISSRSDWDPVSFLLPLGYSRKTLWLDGEAVSTSGGKGPCVAITFDGQQYSLVKKPCKTRLTSACSCYTEPTTTAATTTELVTTTTTTLAPETTTTTTITPGPTTTTPESTTTTPESTTTTTTTREPSSTTTEPTSTTTETTSTTMIYDLSSDTSTMITETTTIPPSTMTDDDAAEDMSSTDKADTYAPWKTMKNAAEEASTMSSWTETTSSALVAEGNASSVFVGENKAELEPEEKTNSELLFPFSDMKESGDPSHIAPPSVSHEESTADDGSPATAAASIEMIVGISVAVAALMLILIIVVIVVKRRKQKSMASLLKAKKPATERESSYPI
ncbi:hypothetical protein ACOMHN_045934 [Nucella lapillus]